MRVAVISDVHGNIEALDEVLLQHARIVGCDQVWCLGDNVGYGPFQKECLDLVRARAKHIAMGNHEAMMVDANIRLRMPASVQLALRYGKEKIFKEDLEYIAGLPKEIIVKDFDVTLVHATVLGSKLWKHLKSEDDIKRALRNMKTGICLVGHTHVPLVYGERSGFLNGNGDWLTLSPDEKYIINPGSVGQPRDSDCRASYMMIEFGKAVRIMHHRVFYDIRKTADAIPKIKPLKYYGERPYKGE